MNKIIGAIEKYNQKVPALPVKVKDIIVKIAPYLAIVGVIFSCLGLLSLFSFLSSGYGVMMAAYAGAMPIANLYIALIVSIVVVIIYVIAIPGLFKRKKSAWNLMFYSQIVSSKLTTMIQNIN